MSLSFRQLLSADQILVSDIELLFKKADTYRLVKSNCDELRGKILATLFFEPSTRTRFSFETAMFRLGGQVISMQQGMSSSVSKGESLSDMGRVISEYADIVVMRHPTSGSVSNFSQFATVPVVNAGDGANQHPTQSLVDLYTIYKQKGCLEGLHVTFLGDLKYGRAVHSFISLLTKYKNTFSFVSHPDLAIPDFIKDKIVKSGCVFNEYQRLSECIQKTDVLYVTRVQQERFPSKEAYNLVKDLYCITADDIRSYKNIIVLHPLPRINEIDLSVDSLPAAVYFKQVSYSVLIRKALLVLLLSSVQTDTVVSSASNRLAKVIV